MPRQKMKATNRVNRKLFHAIKFKHLPFKEIDKYVCVPSSWIIQRLDDQKALIAYPENEAPFVTRNRAKKRETYSSEWSFYIGYSKYKSESYENVEQWIEEMITNGGDDQEEEPQIKEPPPEPVRSRQLRSSRNPLWSGTLTDKPQVAVKTNYNPRRPLPKILIRRPLPLRPWKPKRMEQDKTAKPANGALSKQDQTVIEENYEQSTNHSNEESIDTSGLSSSKRPDDRQLSTKPSDERQPVQDEQLLDMPNIEEFVEEIEIDIEEEPIEDQKLPSNILEQAPQYNPVIERPASVDHEYSLLESRLHEIHTGKPKEPSYTQITPATVRPPSRANQPSHDYVQPLTNNTPCYKPELQRTVVTSSKVTHGYQDSHLQSLVKTIPSTYYSANPIDLSSQRQVHAVKRKSSSAIKKPAETKTRIENITKSIPTPQSLYNKQLNYAGNVGDLMDQTRHIQNMNTSATQNLLHLAHKAPLCEPSHLQYIQHLAQMQALFSRPNIDQRSYFQHAIITGEYSPQNHPSQSNQPRQLLQQHQNPRPLVNTKQIQEMMRHEHLNGPIDKAPQNQLATNLEIRQRQDPLSYQDERVVNPVESQSISGNPQLQVTEEQHLVPPKINQQLLNDQRSYSRKDPRLLAKLSRSNIKYYEIRGTDPETTQYSETQTTSESQMTESKNNYQHPGSKKLVIDQATEMDSANDHREDETVASPPDSMDSWYRTDRHSTKIQESPQEAPDTEMVSADEELLDNVSTDGSDYAMNDDICSKDDNSASITKEKSIDVQNLIPKTHQKLSKMTEDEMLEIHGQLLNKLYKHFTYTEEFYNNLRDSTLGYLRLYEILLNKTEKIKVIKSHSTPTSNATSEVTQVAKEIPIEASKQENCNSKTNNNSSVKSATTKKKRRHTFVLPPEYDPNDTKWTLKHQESGPGLTELIPQSHVYVNKSEYKQCIRASNDCRTLARLLLTAVFSKNALSVCSPTGGRAKAFSTVDMDVRPGLDEHARMVLLAFIDDYGTKRDWNTSDTAGIMSSIRTKIQEMRNKYGKTRVV